MTSSRVQQAWVELAQPRGGWRWLLDKPLAGVPVLDRLLLTLGRVGMDTITLLAPDDLPESRKQELTKRWAGDPRFKTDIAWSSPDQASSSLDREGLRIPGNAVTTAKSLTALLQHGDHPEGSRPVVSFQGSAGQIEWLPEGAIQRHETAGDPSHLLIPVNDAASFRAAERALLDAHKHHYTQLLDVHFNSYFSIPISSLLVKLPVTPNQLTLFGLVIGLAAGILFAQGDFLSGVLGGVLLAFTAIWDCCDGDVARLKFMESDFGEQLDTMCDNIINVFIFTGIAVGVGKTHGVLYAAMPFVLLAIGGLSIFALIYFQQGGKGDFFKGTTMFEVIQLLASRNFIYIILLFALAGKLHWFLWLAGWGSLVFAGILFFHKLQIDQRNPS